MKAMRIGKLSFAFIICLMLVHITRVGAAALSPSEIVSETAVLMDAETGQVLFDKEMRKQMYPASTTKIMTGLLVLEHCESDEIVTVSGKAVFYDDEVSHIALCEGEEITVEQALYALMLPSANDAAIALAEHVAGSEEAFARLMNEKAAEIGAFNTHFVNAHGLHNKGHYTTAYDMALITRYAMNVPGFMTYLGEAQFTMPPNNLQLEERPFVNRDNMLLPWKGEYDERVVGGKVGYTDEARHTMSTVAAENGRTLICVVMYSPYAEYKYSDTKKLLQHGFNSFYSHTIPKEYFPDLTVPVGNMKSLEGSASFRYNRDLTVLLPVDIPPEDIRICYGPSSTLALASEENIACSILLICEGGAEGLPPVLMEVPMEGTVTPVPPPAETVALDAADEAETVPAYAAEIGIPQPAPDPIQKGSGVVIAPLAWALTLALAGLLYYRTRGVYNTIKMCGILAVWRKD